VQTVDLNVFNINIKYHCKEEWNKKLRDWRWNENNTLETENSPILK